MATYFYFTLPLREKSGRQVTAQVAQVENLVKNELISAIPACASWKRWKPGRATHFLLHPAIAIVRPILLEYNDGRNPEGKSPPKSTVKTTYRVRHLRSP